MAAKMLAKWDTLGGTTLPMGEPLSFRFDGLFALLLHSSIANIGLLSRGLDIPPPSPLLSIEVTCFFPHPSAYQDPSEFRLLASSFPSSRYFHPTRIALPSATTISTPKYTYSWIMGKITISILPMVRSIPSLTAPKLVSGLVWVPSLH